MSDTRSVHANILAGPDVLVLEMSRRELLLEADVRLTPGAGICLNVTIGDANYLAGGRVARVDATLAGGQVRYRAGVVLDNEMPAFDQAAVTTPKPAEASRTPAKGAAEEVPMDAAQEHQILKTALRSAEAARKDLVEELHALHAERTKWEEQREALEQRVAVAEAKVDAAARQLSAGKDAAKTVEQDLATRYAKETAAWQAERKTLHDAAVQAQGLVRQADGRIKEAEARYREADARAKQAIAKIAELDAKVKAAEAGAAAAEAKTAAAEAQAPAAEARAAAAETKVAAAETKFREFQARGEQLARDLAATQERERNTSTKFLKSQEGWNTERNALQERVKAGEARVSQLTGDLNASREAEQRLAKQLKAEETKLADMVQENERQIDEMEALRASLKAEQAKGTDLARDNGRLAAEIEGSQKSLATEQARVADLVQDAAARKKEIEDLRAALADAEQAIVRHDQDKQVWASQKERITARLQTTERWCVDQQELLYSLQQHLAGAATLLDGWKPAAIEPAEPDLKATKTKATA